MIESEPRWRAVELTLLSGGGRKVLLWTDVEMLRGGHRGENTGFDDQ